MSKNIYLMAAVILSFSAITVFTSFSISPSYAAADDVIDPDSPEFDGDFAPTDFDAENFDPNDYVAPNGGGDSSYNVTPKANTEEPSPQNCEELAGAISVDDILQQVSDNCKILGLSCPGSVKRIIKRIVKRTMDKQQGKCPNSLPAVQQKIVNESMARIKAEQDKLIAESGL